MARVFTINFSYLGEDRSAMINVRPTPFYTEYAITLFDEEIAHELHSNTIISATNENFRYMDCLYETDLMKNILVAVSHHLQVAKQIS
jgi:hypothetical protein